MVRNVGEIGDWKKKYERSLEDIGGVEAYREAGTLGSAGAAIFLSKKELEYKSKKAIDTLRSFKQDMDIFHNAETLFKHRLSDADAILADLELHPGLRLRGLPDMPSTTEDIDFKRAIERIDTMMDVLRKLPPEKW